MICPVKEELEQKNIRARERNRQAGVVGMTKEETDLVDAIHEHERAGHDGEL